MVQKDLIKVYVGPLAPFVTSAGTAGTGLAIAARGAT
jgi:hypothetical protein